MTSYDRFPVPVTGEELKTSGDAGDAGETCWMLWRRATLCSQACYLWYLPFWQKM